MLEPLVLAEKALRVAQLFLWCPQMVGGCQHVSVCHVRGKMTVVELTQGKEK